jgi:amino acid adenylation domain-containing protein
LSEVIKHTRDYLGRETLTTSLQVQQDKTGNEQAQESEGNFPLSSGQQRLWLLEQITPGLSTYNVPVCLNLTGALQVEALNQSLNQVIQRHQILRTTFPLIEGQPVQQIAASLTIPFLVTDLQTEPEAQRESLLEQLLQQESREPFDLEQGPLVRAHLFQLAEQAHVLLLTLHHIVFDGWSETLLFQEWSELYRAACENTPTSLAPVLHHYVDYVNWQQEWLKGDSRVPQVNYWKEELAGIPSLLALPTDYARPGLSSFRGAHHAFQCSQEIFANVQKLRKQESATLFMILLASWQTLLYRYTSQEDICIGTPVSGRTEEAFQEMLGFLVNTLVLRGRFSQPLSFRELLRQVRETTLDAYEHQEVPFDQVVEALDIEREPSYNPLFQVFFAVDQAVASIPQTFAGLATTLHPIVSDTAKFDLSIRMWETAEGLSGSINYSTDLFAPSTIERMAGHFQILLANLLSAPDQPLNTQPLLTAAEQHQILVEWNATGSVYPRDTCIHQLFEAQASRTPQAIALVCEQQELTYAQLNEQANQLARVLHASGVGPEGYVGLCVERSIAMIVGLLAILKAGGICVPLDPADPQERLAFLFAETGITVLLTRKLFQTVLPPTKAQLLFLDEELPSIPDTDETPMVQPGAESLAYVLFTSGSTGKPKGTSITHRNIVRLVTSRNVVNIEAHDTVLQFGLMTFDVAAFEIWGTLLKGAKLAIFPPQQQAINELGNFIEQQKITTLWLTAGLFHQIIESQIEHLKGVRQLISGGDVLSVTHVRQALQALPDCTIVNGYGPTENSVFTCLAVLTRQSDLSRSVPIGRPVAQTQVYILDQMLQPVPIGVVGELYAGGDGVASGYLHLPELTAERFLSNPFNPDPDARLYKTGDLARYKEDGIIEFLGRNDHQVKIRGFRVEPEEIEAVLIRHSAIQQALVLPLSDPQGDRRLIAYVVPQPEIELSRKVLRQYLETQIPGYLIPAIIMVIEAFPLTAVGKIDRAALPTPDAESGEGFIAPRSMTEIQIARMFSDLLGVYPISARDNFFELGGHSLSAIRLMGRLKKQFNQDVPPSAFFQEATVEHLAQIMYKGSAYLPPYSLVGLQTKGSKPPLILVHPASGNVRAYLRMISFMKEDQPVYAFEESYLSDQWKPCDNVVELAERYLVLLREFQPQGPYYLGGWSFGGVIAFEMARRLERQGQTVALLAMIDSYAPLPDYNPPMDDESSIMSLALAGMRMSWPNHPQGYLPPFLSVEELQKMTEDERWQYLLDVAVKANFADHVEQMQRWVIIYKYHGIANQTYRMEGEPYPAPITLLKMVPTASIDQPEAYTDLGWSHFATGPIDVEICEGDHFGVVGIAAAPMGERLYNAMDRAIEAQKQ